MKNPDVRMLEWCNFKIHVLEVECPDIETFTRIEPDLNELLRWQGGKVLKKNFLEGNLQLLVSNCRCGLVKPNVTDVVQDNSFLLMPPEMYFGGWEEYRVIGFRENDYKRMFEQLGKLGPVEITSKKVIPDRSIHDAFVISLSSVFSELTSKQVSSLLTALESGYYQIPKKMTAEGIALKGKIPRTTFEEHLRKAESKVFRAITPYVRMYASRPQNVDEEAARIQAR
jgi:hypothetical protein